jgi:hypothetical protein
LIGKKKSELDFRDFNILRRYRLVVNILRRNASDIPFGTAVMRWLFFFVIVLGWKRDIIALSDYILID